MESIDVLGRINRHQNLLRVHLRGQRQLHQDPVDVVAAVEIFDQGQQLCRGGRFGRSQLLAVKADFLAGFDLAPHVNLRRRVVPDEHDSQPGTHTRGRHGFHFRGDFASDVLRDPGSVEDGSWHGFGIPAPGFGLPLEILHCRVGRAQLSYNSQVMIAKELLEILVCPACKQALEYRQNPESLKCTQCHRVYAVKDDIPIMLIDESTVEP